MVTEKINLKIWKSNNITLFANQGEINSRNIEVSFEDTNGSLSLAEKKVTFYLQKPDGTKIFNNCITNSEENTATVVITSQMVSIEGYLDCEFQIFDNQGSLLKVNGLKIIVLYNKDFFEAIESTSEFNALIQLINKVEGILGDIQDCSEKVNNLSANMGVLNDLTTTEKSSLVSAVNEVNLELQNNITDIQNCLEKIDNLSANMGVLNDLTTTEKSSLVSAVNEVNLDLQNNITDIQNCLEKIDNLSANMGVLNSLTTTEKSSLVSAVNEVNSKVIPLSKGGTGAETLESARGNLGIMVPTILYQNTSGTNGTVILSDSVENYDYLEIYYRSNDGDVTMCKIHSPNGKMASLGTTLIYNNILYKKTAFLYISSTLMTWSNTGFAIIGNNSTALINSENNLKVLQVVGYK